MNNPRTFQVAAFVLLLLCGCPRPAMAYIGPGTGMTAVGVFLAVVMGIVVALFGFLWYPLKRLTRMCKKQIADWKGEQTA